MDDLALLERVFLRVGSAETDEQLENTIAKFLCPVLLKLASTEESVRKKVMEFLVHINKRVKSRPNLQLPVADLMNLYQDPACSIFLSNFAVVYLKMGLPRMEPARQAELLPQLLNSLQDKPVQHQDSLLHIALPALAHVNASTEALKQPYAFLKEKADLSKRVRGFFLDVLLLPYGLPHPSASSQPVQPPPAMSETGWKRASGESQMKPEQLEETKLGIVKFMSSGIFAEQEILAHLIVAAADTRFSVANAADSALKRIGGAVDWNDVTVVTVLYQLFLGNKNSKESIKPELRRSPACTRLRLKLFTYLIRSREATTHFPSCIQLTFEGLFGEASNAKLKSMALQFLHQMINNCPENRLAPISPVLISGLMKIINNTEGDAKLRGSALVALGKLGQKLPETVTKDMAIIQMLFNAMETEEPETRMAVQEALSTMLPAFKQLTSTNGAILEALLATSLESKQHLLRLIAVQYAGGIFPPTHVTSRYLLLLAAGDPKEEVKSEALKLLYANLPKTSESKSDAMDTEPVQVLPDFVPMVQCVADKAASRIKSRNAVTYGTRTLPFDVAAYAEMLSFLRLCLASSASLSPSLDLLNEPETMGSHSRRYVEQLTSENGGPVPAYLELALDLIAVNPSKVPLECVLQVVGGVPKLSAVVLPRFDMLKALQQHSREEVRELAAQIIAVVVCQSYAPPQIDALIQELCRNFGEKTVEQQHGFIMTLGYTVGRIVRKYFEEHAQWKREDAEKKCKEELADRLSSAVKLVAEFLIDSRHPTVLSAACSAVGEMGRCGPLLDPADDGSRCVGKLLAVVDDAKLGSKIREKAALAAGFLSLGQLEYPHRTLVIQHFLSSAQEIKEIEVQFTIGEALVCAALGANSPESRDHWSVKECEFAEPQQAPSQLDFVLDELLDKHVPHLHPNVKQASSIWLLALVKRCSHRAEMKERLLRVQRSFMNLLAEGGDLVQDIASKGLGLVFECCTPEQQNQLAGELVGSLTTDRRPAVQVTKDTKVFEEGSLGSNPAGGQLSTYKELCSLATDLNQPDLIYKFMHLANHNAIWNSKKGAAFGFHSIAKKAGQQLAPHLPVIVPKLYRYQFDPNPKIQQSMASIWEALVSEQSKTVDLYFQPILDDLIEHLTSNLWRNRESSCMALADLLRGRTLDSGLDKLDVLWGTLFRVVDDIKESVRKAAQTALRALSKVCIKMVDVDSGKVNSQRTVEMLLPVLLQQGLSSSVEEVQAITLETLIKVVKSAGSLVSTHLAPLISALLEATQTVEGQSMNYLSVRLGNQLATQEKLDLARIAAAKSSTLFETAQHCIQFVNEQNAQALVSSLVDLLKGTHGITTKGCVAHVICLLTQQCHNDVQPYAGRLMAVLVKGLGDRNVALKKTYAVALGHLVRVAKESSVVKLMETLETRYLEAEDEESRLACMHTLQAMVRHNPDVVRNHASRTVPIVFLGKHIFKTPETAQLVQSWEELWMDIVPSTETGLKMYCEDIINYLQRAITSSSWKLKSLSAAAIGSMAKSLKGQLSKQQNAALLRILIDGLAGRTWEGKEHLLRALGSLCSTQPIEEVSVRDEIMTIVLREARKEALPYRKHAVEVLGIVVESFNIDVFDTVFEMLNPLFQVPDTDENMEEDEEEQEKGQQLMKLELHEAAISALGKSFPLDETAQGKYWAQYAELLHVASTNTTRQVQLAIVASLHSVAGRIGIDLIGTILKDYNKILAPSLDVTNFTALRIEALKVVIILTKKVLQSDETRRAELMDNLRDVYSLRVEEFLRDSSPEVKSRADEAKRLLLQVN